MSEVAKTARVNLLIADYAAITANGIADLLHAGVAVFYAGRVETPQFEAYSTPGFSVYASIACEPKYIGEEYACSLELRDDSGEVINMPEARNGEKMRLSQILKVEEVQAPNLFIPKGALWPTYQFVWSFPTGMLLEPNKAYSWTVTLDGEVAASYFFYLGIPGQGNQSKSPIIIG
jgi:hypothetical protein